MPQQDELFPPAARTTDPDTSKASAERASRTFRTSQVQRVVEIIRSRPHRTCNELALVSTMTERQLSRRISDAEAKGLIRVSGKRACQVTGFPARTWTTVQGEGS